MVGGGGHRRGGLRLAALYGLLAVTTLACAAKQQHHEPSVSHSSVAIDDDRPVPADGETPAVVVVTLRDAAGQPLAGIPVHAEVSGHGHIITPASITSAADGTARVLIAATFAETKTLRLRAGRIAGGVALAGTWQLRFVAGAPAPAQCTITALSGLYAATDGGGAPLRVVVRDRFRNPVADVMVELSTDGEGHQLMQPSLPTNAAGEVVGALACRQVATKIVRASVRTALATILLEQHAEIRFADRPMVAGAAAFADMDSDGICAQGDTLTVPLGEPIVLQPGVTAATLLTLPCASDTLGEDPRTLLAPAQDGLVLQLGKHPRLRARGVFSAQWTTANAPSGIQLAAPLPAGTLVSRGTGLSAASGSSVDLFADLVRRDAPWPLATCVALGDLDTDGDQDVVFGRPDGSVVWSRNDRWRGFAPSVALVQCAAPPGSLVLADLDIDGRLDLVVATAQDVVAWPGRAGAVFAGPHKLLAVGGALLLAADLEGDARQEVIAATADGSCFVVQFGDLAPRRVFTMGAPVRGLAGVDLDHDGDLDLVLAAGSAVRVLAQTSPGEFAVAATLPYAADALVTTDFDADGDIDLAAGGAHGVRLWWNLAALRFIDAGLQLGMQPVRTLRALDVDGDADADLLSAAQDGGLWLNQRPGFVRARSGWSVPDATSLVPADLDLDGDADIVAVTPAGPAQRWLGSLAAVRGELEFTPPVELGAADRPAAIVAADLDADGDVDAIVAHARGGTRVLRNEPEGSFTDSGQVYGVFDYTMALATGDVDGDGDVDFVTGNMVDQAERLYRNDGGGRFVESAQAIGAGHTTALALADFDGDGDLDLLAGNLAFGGRGNRLFANDGRGHFTQVEQTLGVLDTRALAAGDLDGDGDVDVVVGGADGSVTFYRNLGRGVFAAASQSLRTARLGALALGDLDRDGDLDLVVGVDAAEPDRVFGNDGYGAFVDSGQSLGAEPTVGLVLADVDVDGDIDVLSAAFGAAPRLRRNDGRGRFMDFPLHAPPALAVFSADCNRDGDLDVFLAGSDGRLRLLRSR